MSKWTPSLDKFLSESEMNHLRDTLIERAEESRKTGTHRHFIKWSMLIEVLLGSGLRVNEVRNIRISDIYTDNGNSFMLGPGRVISRGTL